MWCNFVIKTNPKEKYMQACPPNLRQSVGFSLLLRLKQCFIFLLLCFFISGNQQRHVIRCRCCSQDVNSPRRGKKQPNKHSGVLSRSTRRVMLKEQENEQILNVVNHFDCQIRRKKLASSTAQIKHWRTEQKTDCGESVPGDRNKLRLPSLSLPFCPYFSFIHLTAFLDLLQD